MSIFEHSKRRGCPVCGEPTVMAVAIQARKLNDKRKPGIAVTRQRIYCAEHGESLYLALLTKMGAEL